MIFCFSHRLYFCVWIQFKMYLSSSRIVSFTWTFHLNTCVWEYTRRFRLSIKMWICFFFVFFVFHNRVYFILDFYFLCHSFNHLLTLCFGIVGFYFCLLKPSNIRLKKKRLLDINFLALHMRTTIYIFLHPCADSLCVSYSFYLNIYLWG